VTDKTESVEKQLLAWKPCGPSAQLRGRVFGQPGLAGGPVLAHSWRVPAGIGLLLLLAAASHWQPSRAPASAADRDFFAVVLSNRSLAAWAAGSERHARNGPPGDRFEWVHGTRIPERVASGEAMPATGQTRRETE